ncbi:MAG: glycoside hydrolase family 9 protein [Chitinispirillaceae bacterium]
MNRSSILFTAILLFSTLPTIASEEIRLNQLGFHPESRKFAIVIDTDETEFQVISASDGKTAFKGALSSPQSWSQSGETGRQADFTSFDTPGKYRIKIKGKDPSHPFSISKDVFSDVAKASMRSYYFQRCSFELTKKLAGKWARAAGHPDTAVTFHPSSGKKSGKMSSPGGWYDAGDFGKYIVNSGISTGTLLAFYENYPDVFPDKTLRIPESGNGRPDILDEIKVNLDWMKTMQDEDGGVFFKLTTKKFPGYIMPDQDTTERFIIGKSTSSALNFAAVMAMAGRIYTDFDKDYAADCIKRAKKAWKWAREYPDSAFSNPSDVQTGEYGDQNFTDEFTWAAAELFITTREEAYGDFLRQRDLHFSSAPFWREVGALAAYSLATRDNGLPPETISGIRKSIVKAADNWIGDISRSLYRIPKAGFVWGSNSVYANIGVNMIYAYRITGENPYLLAASEIADYLLGKNATGYSFVTGFGTKATSNPHHRHSIAAGVGPVPGFMAGGPNASRQDSAYSPYSSRLPAKSYMDNHKSYASNEVAINWNAPSTFLFGSIDAEMKSFRKKGPYALTALTKGNGRITAKPLKKTYASKDEITLTAEPQKGFVFSHWTGAASDRTNPTRVRLSSNARVTAVFIDPSEMIVNSDFSSGLPPWDFGVHQKASASGSTDQGWFTMKIGSGGEQSWNVQLTQGGLNLQKGKKYKLSFTASADSTREVFPNVGMSQDPWKSYTGDQKVFNVGPEKKTYSFVFTMQDESDSNGRVEINCGKSNQDVKLYKVSLKEVTE